MSDEIIQHSARAVIAEAVRRSVTLTTAESCTGGMVSAALTAIEGSSAAFGWGFVTYSNLAKQTLLDVSAADLERYGAVSEVVARAMATGARRASNADIAVAITGIAGPGGGSPAKPVGLVHFGLSTRTASCHRVEMFGALGRDQVRQKSVIVALDLFREALTDFGPSQTG